MAFDNQVSLGRTGRRERPAKAPGMSSWFPHVSVAPNVSVALTGTVPTHGFDLLVWVTVALALAKSHIPTVLGIISFGMFLTCVCL